MNEKDLIYDFTEFCKDCKQPKNKEMLETYTDIYITDVLNGEIKLETNNIEKLKYKIYKILSKEVE